MFLSHPTLPGANNFGYEAKNAIHRTPHEQIQTSEILNYCFEKINMESLLNKNHHNYVQLLSILFLNL